MQPLDYESFKAKFLDENLSQEGKMDLNSMFKLDMEAELENICQKEYTLYLERIEACQ